MNLVLFSQHQANVLSRASPDIGLLSSVNDAVRLTNLIFEATTTPSAQENTHMSILSTYGDSFLKMAVSIAIYPDFVSGKIPKPGAKKDAEVRNSNLRRLASKRGLMSYLNSTKIVFIGGNANWLPPGYTISGEHADRYLKQKIDQKAFGDMIEALIGAFLISTGDATTIRFMNWLGLHVVWNESTGKPRTLLDQTMFLNFSTSDVRNQFHLQQRITNSFHRKEVELQV